MDPKQQHPADETPPSQESEQRKDSDRRGPDRRSVVDRRIVRDRRVKPVAFTGIERRVKGRRIVEGERRSGFDRRRGPGRRRTESRRSAEEGEMTPEQFEFIQAISEYKQVNKKPFPTWTEVLDLIKALGYRKVAQPSNISDV